jgi:hypothetical protein
MIEGVVRKGDLVSERKKGVVSVVFCVLVEGREGKVGWDGDGSGGGGLRDDRRREGGREDV